MTFYYLYTYINKMSNEQDEINASYERIVKLDMMHNCIECKKRIQDGISFCNALCENAFSMDCRTTPTTTLGVADDYEDLITALDKSSVDLFIARNQNNRGWSDIPLAITHFESPLNAKETSIQFMEFASTKKTMVVEDIAICMFYKCHYSEEFAYTSMNVKFYFHENRHPTVEFRKMNGCSSLFINIYQSFKNYIFNEFNEKMNFPPNCNGMDVPISSIEEDSCIAHLIEWMNISPNEGIKVACMVAMEKDFAKQVIICNEIYNAIMRFPTCTLRGIACQVIGFIDAIRGPTCKLAEEHKNSIVFKLTDKLNEIDDKSINASVRLRIQNYIN